MATHSSPHAVSNVFSNIVEQGFIINGVSSFCYLLVVQPQLAMVRNRSSWKWSSECIYLPCVSSLSLVLTCFQVLVGVLFCFILPPRPPSAHVYMTTSQLVSRVQCKQVRTCLPLYDYILVYINNASYSYLFWKLKLILTDNNRRRKVQ